MRDFSQRAFLPLYHSNLLKKCLGWMIIHAFFKFDWAHASVCASGCGSSHRRGGCWIVWFVWCDVFGFTRKSLSAAPGNGGRWLVWFPQAKINALKILTLNFSLEEGENTLTTSSSATTTTFNQPIFITWFTNAEKSKNGPSKSLRSKIIEHDW